MKWVEPELFARWSVHPDALGNRVTITVYREYIDDEYDGGALDYRYTTSGRRDEHARYSFDVRDYGTVPSPQDPGFLNAVREAIYVAVQDGRLPLKP